MEGRIIAAKRSRRASPFGQLCATIIKVRVQEQSSRHVDRTGKPCEPWDKTDRNQSESRKPALPSHETNSSLPARKNQIARPLVVLAIHPCNGHEVRELPKEEHREEHPCLEAQPPRCCSPADQWRHRSRKGADQRA